MAICQFCNHTFKSNSAVRQHQSQYSSITGCYKKRNTWWKALWDERKAQNRNLGSAPIDPGATATYGDSDGAIDVEMSMESPRMNVQTGAHSVNIHEQIEKIPEDQDAITPSRLARVDEVPDETAEYPRGCYLRSFPGEKSAGLTYGEAKLPFQAIHDEQVLQGADIFGPFESEEEWDLAKWLIKNVGHTQAEKFLKLPIVRKVYI